MKNLVLLLAVFFAMTLTDTTWAGDAPAAPQSRLELNLVDGSHIIGVSSIESVPVRTSYAKLNLPLQQIRTIKIEEDHETAAVALRNGDSLKGIITLGRVQLETVFGKVSIGVEHIKELRVVLVGGATNQQGLVLWNRLDTESAVEKSRVGPGGKLNGGRFVQGRFGKGIELQMNEPFGVTFPAEILPVSAGCIEFWAKLVAFPQALPWGGQPGLHPGLIGIDDKDGNQKTILQFNGNDGASDGGLCAFLEGFGYAGTAEFGNWTYMRALGTNAVGDWHHYALVWNHDGIPGVTGRFAVFVDGRLNTGSWNGTAATPGQLSLPKDGRLGFLCHQDMTEGSVVFDNLKIWNYAKTDFSDRNDE